MGVAIVTGFLPFGGHMVNPAQQIAEALHGCRIGGLEVVSYCLPVAFDADTAILLPAILDLEPALVLCLGLQAGAASLNVERLAVNLRSKDGQGDEQPIASDGPAAYFSTIDVDFVIASMLRAGIPARPHVYAGSYLCNHIMYQALHFCSRHSLPTRVGFVHLPLSTQQTVVQGCLDAPSLPLHSMLAGIRMALELAGQVTANQGGEGAV